MSSSTSINVLRSGSWTFATPSIYKYWTSLSTGEEHVFDLSNDQLELTNLIGPVDPKRLNHWRLHTLKSAAGVVLTETDQ